MQPCIQFHAPPHCRSARRLTRRLLSRENQSNQLQFSPMGENDTHAGQTALCETAQHGARGDPLHPYARRLHEPPESRARREFHRSPPPGPKHPCTSGAAAMPSATRFGASTNRRSMRHGNKAPSKATRPKRRARRGLPGSKQTSSPSTTHLHASKPGSNQTRSSSTVEKENRRSDRAPQGLVNPGSRQSHSPSNPARSSLHSLYMQAPPDQSSRSRFRDNTHRSG